MPVERALEPNLPLTFSGHFDVSCKGKTPKNRASKAQFVVGYRHRKRQVKRCGREEKVKAGHPISRG